ncbi:BZ3500_MvSof-1268-A1-R1_Chr10-3g03080 [Microbotryum saponariae]|uniref:BZ3500_MvSof-1268-A1-R1_Chr10-3g03080 protein n=1 Tax=Microbotryum saponariae TaxID=289078 RepID=A0A2X0KZT5_9BASI|nr:BZ3501_MvSof-1269-A2-R1_Chr10-2g02658 [Microbotryum saponariae]SDA02112.1 BZ3500_MvSof-1268-A1-R1_Chr10-3g03080 [Microbotryum saponariae]
MAEPLPLKPTKSTTKEPVPSRTHSKKGPTTNGGGAARSGPRSDTARKTMWDLHAGDLQWDWVDECFEQDMEVFGKACNEDTPTDGTDTPLEKIRAVSDFAPIREKVRRWVERRGKEGGSTVAQPSGIPLTHRGPKRRRDIVREGWAYHVSRWPLLFIIFTVISIEFLAYVMVRQIVNLIEYFGSCKSRGPRIGGCYRTDAAGERSNLAGRGQRGKLRQALRRSRNFEEWKERALLLDAHLRFNEWKRSAPNAYYDSPLIRRVLNSLRELREKGDAEGVMAVLHAALRNNFAGSESFRLYRSVADALFQLTNQKSKANDVRGLDSETFYGTKDLVQDYVDEVARSIELVRKAPLDQVPLEIKHEFFRSSAKNLGATALCLSGGAGLGYYHFGVVRALLDTNTLPRVVTGTSAGSIVAAFLCTRTDDELRRLLVPELADRISACEEGLTTWLPRLLKTGARFEATHWARKASFFTMGNMTFREAFERTGRILNISVIPYDTHSPTKLLNYLTAPDCVIYSASIASSAVPSVMNPVVLLQKDKDGKVKPWEFGGKHKDGSLRVDIPLQALHLLYNVNFSVVSQVNPHIHLFAFAPRGAPGRPVAHRRGKGWRGGFLLSAAEQFLKIELTKNFRVIRDLELMPEFGGQNWSALFLQDFEGTVTIWPRSRFWDWFQLLSDPNRAELARKLRVGQMATFPRVKMIENRLKIERQIDRGREDVLKEVRKRKSGAEQFGGRIDHRDSSVDRWDELSRVREKDALGGKIKVPEEAVVLDDDDDEEGEEGGTLIEPGPAPSTSKDGRTHSLVHNAERRKEILARLGLKNAETMGSTNPRSTTEAAVFAGEDSEGEITKDHRTLRRRYSMGTLRRSKRSKSDGNRRTTMFGDETSSEDEEDDFLSLGQGSGGRGGGWSSTGSQG